MALIEGTWGYSPQWLLPAIDRWKDDAGRYPDLFPLWCRIEHPNGGRFPAPDILDGFAARGIEPMIYMTSVVPYEDIVAGAIDQRLEDFAKDAEDYGQRVIVRWNHEMNTRWMPWGLDREGYIESFRYLHSLMPSNAHLYFCPWAKSDMLDYFPGEQYARAVGFDKYSTRESQDSIPNQWRPFITKLRSVSRRKIIVGEFGRARGLSRRNAWIRTVHDIRVWASIYFDVDMSHVEPWDWRMTTRMKRTYMG